MDQAQIDDGLHLDAPGRGRIYDSIIETIGNTPLVRAPRLAAEHGAVADVCFKLEFFNPIASVKDRIGVAMILDLERRGKIGPHTTLVEPTSGNTGIGMAMVARAKGYRIKLCMPACVSEERRAILTAYGAELDVTPACSKTDGAIKRAHHILETEPDLYFMPNQFANQANPLAHYETTAPEILRDTDGEVTAFVAGMGTSGTLMGCSRRFREADPRILIVAVEPTVGHTIQGLKSLAEAIVPDIYDRTALDAHLICEDEDAFETMRDLMHREGLFCGMSSGAAVWGAMEIARDLPRGSTVVTVLPDRGDRYLSTEIFRSICAQCPP